MSYAACRDAIVAAIETVEGAGVVNGYRRSITTYDAFESAFTVEIDGQRHIRGWDVAWERGVFDPASWAADGMKLAGEQVYTVRGYMGTKDDLATDEQFSALIEDVLFAVAKAGAGLTPRQAWSPVALRSNAFMMFEVPGIGRTLIHTCEIAVTLRAEEVVN